jgi:hypothetical protein
MGAIGHDRVRSRHIYIIEDVIADMIVSVAFNQRNGWMETVYFYCTLLIRINDELEIRIFEKLG